MTLYEKIEKLKKDFASFSDPQEKYLKIMEMGKQLPPLDPQFQIDTYRVQGCQSTSYLYTTFNEGKVAIHASSDALISAGLLALLIAVYSDETPTAILESPPTFLIDLGLEDSLSPSRANGFADALLRLKKKALEYLVSEQKKISG